MIMTEREGIRFPLLECPGIFNSEHIAESLCKRMHSSLIITIIDKSSCKHQMDNVGILDMTNM